MAWADWVARVQPYAEKLAIWRGYEGELETLAILGIGIAVYTALVFAFYNALSRRKPVHLPFSDDDGWSGRVGRTTERALLFPVISFLYFAVLATALIVMAKTQAVGQILLFSMATVVGVRVTVYLSQSMSNDLAKLVPLSLLAVVLVDPGYIKLSDVWLRFQEAANLWPLLGRYFLLFIALEAVMSSGRWLIVRSGEKWSDLGIASSTKKEETTLSVEVKDGSAPTQKR